MSADDDIDQKMLVLLTVGELRQLVRGEVERALRNKATPPRWVDVGAAGKYFGCSTQTIRNWIRLGGPARQIGSTSRPQYRIELVEFEAWVLAQGKS